MTSTAPKPDSPLMKGPVNAAHASQDEARALELRYQALVSSQWEKAVRMAWRLLEGDRAAAEDVVQESFLRAWKALPTFRSDAEISTWFFRILVRQVGNHQRWKGVRKFWHGLLKEQTPTASLPQTGDQGLQRRLTEAMQKLSPGQREAFVLVHLEGFSLQEAAELLDRSPGTLKSHLHRALTTLRAELNELVEEGTFHDNP